MQIDKEEIFELLKKRMEEGDYKDYFLKRTVKVLAIMNKRMQLPEKVCEVSKILVEVYLVGADDMDRCYHKLLKNAPEYKKTPEIWEKFRRNVLSPPESSQELGCIFKIF